MTTTDDYDCNPTVSVRRTGTHGLVVVRCPHCGRREHHLHGTGSDAGPDYGHRLAHCLPQELPPSLRGKSLGYVLRLATSVEAGQMSDTEEWVGGVRCEAIVAVSSERCGHYAYTCTRDGWRVCGKHKAARKFITEKQRSREAARRIAEKEREAAQSAAREAERARRRTFAAGEVLAAVEMLERVKPWSARSAAPSFMGTLRELVAEGDGGVRLSPKQSDWLELLIAAATDKDREAKWPPEAWTEPQPEAASGNVVPFRRRASP